MIPLDKLMKSLPHLPVDPQLGLPAYPFVDSLGIEPSSGECS